ncbi:MAG: NAD-dependent epimerase/dehydratase family protein [Proteobacteria bacterium]|nr:NAD-dependent epimerase/dehydratase family protein [Pseudomonadota bacterium]
MRWLITGGCGFLGTSLIKNLIDEGGHIIRVLDNLSTGTAKDLSTVCNFEMISDYSKLSNNGSVLQGCQLITNDIRDLDACKACSQNMDIIVHLAANTGVAPSVENPCLDMEVNVNGTVNMLEAARMNQVKRFIFASSGAPVGECSPPIHEELAPHPVSPYGASKLAGEGYCSAYHKTFGIMTVALRFGNVYGPGSGHKNSVVAKFIKRAIAGETLEIFGDGSQTRDFIYIDDLIQAIRLAENTANVGGEVFQIATNKETTVDEMTSLLVPELKAAGLSGIKVVHGDKRLGDVMRNYSDTSKAREKLGWTAVYSLETGLNKTVAWFIN